MTAETSDAQKATLLVTELDTELDTLLVTENSELESINSEATDDSDVSILCDSSFEIVE